MDILLENSVIVRESPIEGKGIFLSVAVPAHTPLMVISGEVIDGYECERREIEENNVYIFWNDETYIDTAATEKIKYINHACTPNCYVTDHSPTTLLLVSARDIKENEELTIDYGYDEIYELCSCTVCRNKLP